MEQRILTTAMGAWGDVFTSLTVIEQIIQHLPSTNKVEILYYGFDAEIAKFLEYQPNIGAVTHVLPKSHEDYNLVIDRASNSELNWIEEVSDFRLKDIRIIPTHLRYETMHPELIFRDLNYKLPDLEFDIPKRSILLNPVSFNSCRFEEHCPITPKIIEFLVKESGWNFVLVGKEKTKHAARGEYWDYPYQIDMPNVLNLVGKTKSMAEVLAIAELCDGIVTTSNCLSMWSILSKKPAIVLLNSKLTFPYVVGHYYYREWINSEPNTLLKFDDDFATFMKVYNTWNENLKLKNAPAVTEPLEEYQECE